MPAGVFFERYERDMAIIRWPIHRAALAVGLAAVYLWPLAAGSPYLLTLAIQVMAWSMAAAGLNMLFGLAGQISLAQGAFMALGAFTAIYLASLGVPPLLTIPLAGVVVAFVGLAFGLPSLRLKELYLLIATLAAQFFFDWLFPMESMAWFSGGPYAKIAPPLSIGPLVLEGYWAYAALATVALGHMLMLANIGRSYIGRALKAIRDRDIAAEIVGVNLFKYKLLAFAVSAYMAAVGGAMWAYGGPGRVVTVESFTLLTSIEVLAAVLVGGLGRLVWGSLLGSAFVVGVPEGLKVVANWIGVSGVDVALKEVAFGGLIVAFLLVEPLGLTELLRKVKERIRLFPYRYY